MTVFQTAKITAHATSKVGWGERIIDLRNGDVIRVSGHDDIFRIARTSLDDAPIERAKVQS
jgi:hypothetical protein